MSATPAHRQDRENSSNNNTPSQSHSYIDGACPDLAASMKWAQIAALYERAI